MAQVLNAIPDTDLAMANRLFRNCERRPKADGVIQLAPTTDRAVVGVS